MVQPRWFLLRRNLKKNRAGKYVVFLHVGPRIGKRLSKSCPFLDNNAQGLQPYRCSPWALKFNKKATFIFLTQKRRAPTNRRFSKKKGNKKSVIAFLSIIFASKYRAVCQTHVAKTNQLQTFNLYSNGNYKC